MTKPKRVAALALAITSSLVVSACAGTETTPPTSLGANTTEDGFGSPGDPADSDRIVEIIATDGLAFEPTDVTVAAGETITFRIVNQGDLVHDFTLGDEATQDEHEAEMAEGGMIHDEPNVANIPGGESVELTWTFPDSGTVLIGCHQPGHYDAGMRGQITIDA